MLVVFTTACFEFLNKLLLKTPTFFDHCRRTAKATLPLNRHSSTTPQGQIFRFYADATSLLKQAKPWPLWDNQDVASPLQFSSWNGFTILLPGKWSVRITFRFFL